MAASLVRCWLLAAAFVAVATLFAHNHVHSPMTVAVAVNVLRGIPDEQRLLTRIQRNYEKRVRPVYNCTHRVTIKFALTLVQIIDVVCCKIFPFALISIS